MVRMKAPPGRGSSMSIEGVGLEIRDGFVEVTPSLVETLEAHGFTRDDGSPTDTSRSGLVRYFVDGARAVAENLSNEQLLAISSVPDERKVAFWERISKLVVEFPTERAEPPKKVEEPKKAEEQKAPTAQK